MRIRATTPKEQILTKNSDCRQCGRCCMFGSGILLPDEIERVAGHLHITPEQLKHEYLTTVTIYNRTLYKPRSRGRPYGPCIFLREGMCSIHDVKPLQCSISTCGEDGSALMEWYYINYILDRHDPVAMREWELRLESFDTIPGGSTEELTGDQSIRDKFKRMRQ